MALEALAIVEIKAVVGKNTSDDNFYKWFC
jgi:hypothetical protein